MEAIVWIALIGFVLFLIGYLRFCWDKARQIEDQMRERHIQEVHRLKEAIVNQCRENNRLMESLPKDPELKNLMTKVEGLVNPRREVDTPHQPQAVINPR